VTTSRKSWCVPLCDLATTAPKRWKRWGERVGEDESVEPWKQLALSMCVVSLFRWSHRNRVFEIRFIFWETGLVAGPRSGCLFGAFLGAPYSSYGLHRKQKADKLYDPLRLGNYDCEPLHIFLMNMVLDTITKPRIKIQDLLRLDIIMKLSMTKYSFFFLCTHPPKVDDLCHKQKSLLQSHLRMIIFSQPIPFSCLLISFRVSAHAKKRCNCLKWLWLYGPPPRPSRACS